MCPNKKGDSSKKQYLKVFHINVRSLRSKYLQLEAFLVDKEIDILCITEHWMSPEEISVQQLLGYKIAGYYAREAFSGGGTARQFKY